MMESGSVHRIEWMLYPGGFVHNEFICDGDDTSPCHQYSECDHDHGCGCPQVAHDECLFKPWMDEADLEDLYDGPPTQVRPAAVNVHWTGGRLAWTYVED